MHPGIGKALWKNDWLGTAALGCPGIMPAEMLTGDREEYKKVYGVRRDCMPCTYQPAGAFLLTWTACSCNYSAGRLGVTGGLRRCQVIPAEWLWFPGTKTNSAAVIRYRFPDNLSAAKVFFRIWPHILPIAIHYR